MSNIEQHLGSVAPPSSLGKVVSLRAFPVKSMDAVPTAQAQVLASGLEHDRGWAVLEGDDVLTARSVPELRDVQAAAPQGGDGGPALLLPGSDHAVRGAQADAALSQAIGRTVVLRPAPGSGPGFNEVAAVHLVSRQAVQRAAADQGTAVGDPACSVEEPRANIVLELADAHALETAWVGQDLRLGDVVLRVSKQPRNCLGVYASVVQAGTVRVGDDVRLG